MAVAALLAAGFGSAPILEAAVATRADACGLLVAVCEGAEAEYYARSGILGRLADELIAAVVNVRPSAIRSRKRLADALPDGIQHRVGLATPSAPEWQVVPPLTPPAVPVVACEQQTEWPATRARLLHAASAQNEREEAERVERN
eukprot:8739486-Alexandrium_andersonii.AAC.1